jgi:hypothetical protein
MPLRQRQEVSGNMRPPNDRLRALRLSQLSPSGSGRRLSRQELADLVNAELLRSDGRYGAMDATYIGKLERGEHRWPQERYRRAFRVVLGAQTDSELGFFVIRRQTEILMPDSSPTVTATLHLDLPVSAKLTRSWTTRGAALTLTPGNAVSRDGVAANK